MKAIETQNVAFGSSDSNQRDRGKRSTDADGGGRRGDRAGMLGVIREAGGGSAGKGGGCDVNGDSGVERVMSTDRHGKSVDRRRMLRGAMTTAGTRVVSLSDRMVDSDEMEVGRLERTDGLGEVDSHASLFASQRTCGGAVGLE